MHAELTCVKGIGRAKASPLSSEQRTLSTGVKPMPAQLLVGTSFMIASLMLALISAIV